MNGATLLRSTFQWTIKTHGSNEMLLLMQRPSSRAGPMATNELTDLDNNGRRQRVIGGNSSYEASYNNHSGHGEQRNGPTHDYRRYSGHQSVICCILFNSLTGPHGTENDDWAERDSTKKRGSSKQSRLIRKRYIILFLLGIAAVATGIGVGVDKGTHHHSTGKGSTA